MELLIEFIGELLFEGIFELIKSKTVPKIIRYLLLIITICLYLLLIGFILLVGIKLILKHNYILGILLISSAVVILMFLIGFVKNVFKN